MKNEKLKFSKLESIQMSNFLMKKELISYLDGKNKNIINKKKFLTFISNFIEDLFNIINQQILTCSQVYESNSDSQVHHLINNNKNISYSMILNFYDKITSYFDCLKNKFILSRNLSNDNIINKKTVTSSYSDRYYNLLNFEKKLFKKKYKTHFNSPKNSLLNSNNSYYNTNLNSMILSNTNSSNIDSINNIKDNYIDINKLKKNKDNEEIQILVKSNKIKENKKKKNINNKIILTKQIYKVCNLIPISRKNYTSNEKVRKNSFNKKIKCNRINIKKSKNNLKNINLSNYEENKK